MKKELGKAEPTATKNEITIKETTQKRYVIVYDSVYKNTKLTAEELGVLVKLITLAPTFKPTKDKLITLLKISERHLLKATKSLQEKGYLKINKHGNKSDWIVNQEPLKRFENLTKQSLVNALLTYDATLKDIKELHRQKLIDDNLFIAIKDDYIKELSKIAKTKWLND